MEIMAVKPWADVSRLPDAVLALATRAMHVGSRVTCNPALTDTDDDYLILVPTPATGEVIYNLLCKNGWMPDGEDHYAGLGQFVSFRRGDMNIIVTDSPDFYAKFELATHVAAALNIQRKRGRIMLFQAMLYGVKP
jgi:hypothetical protein